MKIIKLMVDKLLLPISAVEGQTAQKRYYDDVMKGFGVRVTSGGTKAFLWKSWCRASCAVSPWGATQS